MSYLLIGIQVQQYKGAQFIERDVETMRTKPQIVTVLLSIAFMPLYPDYYLVWGVFGVFGLLNIASSLHLPSWKQFLLATGCHLIGYFLQPGWHRTRVILSLS